jgi:hypothetical protein
MNRPYSSLELVDLINDVYAKHRLGECVAIHSPCMHKYKVKKGGRKEQHLLENGPNLDDQTCSVCFKIRTSGGAPENLLIDTDYDKLTRQIILDTDTFYRWLYRHDY